MSEWTRERHEAVKSNELDTQDGRDMLAEIDRCWEEIARLQGERDAAVNLATDTAEKLVKAAAEVERLTAALAERDAHAANAATWRTTAERYCDTIDKREREIDRLRAELAARPAPAAACTAILGSPQPCAETHDVAPGAYPAEVSEEARAIDAMDAFGRASNWGSIEWRYVLPIERAGWSAVVRAVDASRPGPTEFEIAQRRKLEADLRDVAAWHEGEANKDAATWEWHTRAASKCYVAADAVSRGDIPADVRAGDIAVVVSPHDRYLHDGPEETCEWPSCKEARAGAKESS